jgi:hypothetical protein
MTVRTGLCRSFAPSRLVCLLALAALWAALATPQTADAIEAKPFAIKGFQMQTIERTEEIEVEKPENEIFKKQGMEFVNKPYAFTQAGGHPWALATSGEVTSEQAGEYGLLEKFFDPGAIPLAPTQDPKDIAVGLPPGLLGNPQAVETCSLAAVTSGRADACPPSTVVGWYKLAYGGNDPEYVGPIVNVTPAAGESAEFALENATPLDQGLLTAHIVRAENPLTKRREYEFTVDSNEIPLIGMFKFELTFWGVPADHSHDAMRGRFCKRTNVIYPLECEGGGQSAGVAPKPFLSLGTDCAGGPQTATIRADTWQNPGSVREGRYSGYVQASATMPALTGCDRLSFAPTIEVHPDTNTADEPVGLGVDLDIPQNEQPGANSTPQLRDAVVTLPAGLSISPSVVDGIEACEESGPRGINFGAEEVGPSGELQLAPGDCPDASIIGSAEAVSPFLAKPLKGEVYLARPLCGGAGQPACTIQDALDGRLYQVYLELGGRGELADAGINIKAHGYVEANPATGQLTTRFLQNPQTPFSELKIDLAGGASAALDNPPVCGLAMTSARFTPWSAPGTTPEGLLVAGTPDATPSALYEVSGCTSPPPLRPGFVAGTTPSQAGQFTQFTVDLSRQDREQYVKGIQLHAPPGLLGMLASVPLCGEPAADAGACPQASKIGTTRVASGAGPRPFEIEGSVYLTGPHDGAPFGLSVVTHAVAGPFDLGLVVVRARIDVDPNTSALTVTTDESGPHAVPQIIFGIPLRLQTIAVDVDRPNFMFNPTSCAAQQITAVVSGSENATATLSSPFATAECRGLAFKPKFSAATGGRTSRLKGASLDVRLSYPSGALGKDANIAFAKVSLPKQLPSRLGTLQKACLASTFETNPAACPRGSIVGVARAYTPLLPTIPPKPCNHTGRGCVSQPPTSVTGPVYFVSHGGERFPSLIVVLQGDGVRVDLTGETFIKRGVTSTTFRTLPDVPVSSFELYLPQDRFSALAANGNLCKQRGRLRMPTEFIAQNGAIFRQSTKIAVGGCATTRRGRAHGHRRQRRRPKAASGAKGGGGR